MKVEKHTSVTFETEEEIRFIEKVLRCYAFKEFISSKELKMVNDILEEIFKI